MDSNKMGLLVGLAIAVVVGYVVFTALPAPDESTKWNQDVTPAPVPTDRPTPTATPETFSDESLDMKGFGEELGGDPAGDVNRLTGAMGGFGEELGGDPAGSYCPEPPELTSTNWRNGALDDYSKACHG